MRIFSGRQTLPLRIAVNRLGGKTDWISGDDTLEVYSELKEIRVSGGKLSVGASMSFRPKATVLTNPGRVIIDLNGVRIGAFTRKVLDFSARVHQYKPNVARIIVDTDALPDLDQIAREPVRTLEVDLKELKTTVPAGGRPDTTPARSVGGDPVPQDPVVTPPADLPPLDSLPLQLQQETGSRVSLRIPLGERLTRAAEVRNPDADTLEITLPGVFVNLAEGFQLDTASVTSVRSETTEEGTVLTLELSRPMGAEVVTQGGTVLVSLLKPNVGDGHLAGKVIVVDPGHGGHDGGAKSGDVREKDLNLKIGKLIAEALTAEGATVIMTRKTDVFIPLNKRAEIANQSNADFFISSHINSTGGAATQSGTITFHHKGREVSRVLATCIQRELAKVNKLPDKGVWSDGKIYKSGFAVLRQTTMPGVLLELGFINHPRDRARLVTEDFQRSVAAAVVRGIKVFLGDAKKND
jgi:N-acetylmuramoyl-L-alanine amidase